MNRTHEPVRYTAFLQALFLVLGGLGVQISTDQQGLILGAVSAVVAIVGGELAKRKVTPVARPRDDEGRRLVPEPTAPSTPNF